MLANEALKFQKGIGWVAQVKPETGRKVSLEIVSGKVIQENLHSLSKALARKSAIWEWSWGGTFKLFTWNTATLKALAHWLQKMLVTNSCMLIWSCKLLLYRCFFSKRYCSDKPWWGARPHSLLFEGTFPGGKKSWVSAASYNSF